jgi:hypothetical protein
MANTRSMPFILFIFTLFVPRLVIAILWFFTSWFNGMFESWIIPLVGFIFTPYTLLWYSVVIHYFDGVWGLWQYIFLGIAILLDVSQLAKKR